MKRVYLKLLPLVLALVAFSCNKEDDVKSNEEKPKTEKKDYTVYKFIHGIFADYYYWQSSVPDKIDYTKLDSPYDVLESFRHKDDRFSSVINNYNETSKWFENEYKTDGLNYELYRVDKTSDKVYAVVNYVYDDSPAKEAGLKRGDAITEINGTTLTVQNYSELLNLPSCSYTYENLSSGKKGTTDVVTKIDMTVNPVLQVKTFEKNGKKIGYFLYDAFTSDGRLVLDVIQKLKDEQITDLVLDLRLNGGGSVATEDTLASALVPDGNAGKIFKQMRCNSLLTRYFIEEYGPDCNTERFIDITPKLNLSTLYVIISYNTASASEELISGLIPYMNVVLIGSSNTFGKFTSNMLLNDKYDGDGADDDGIPYTEWAAYVSIGTNVNAKGEMNFANGFTPDYFVKEDFIELGTEEEPMLQKAVSLITGQETPVAKKAKASAVELGTYIRGYGKPEITYGASLCKKKLKLR